MTNETEVDDDGEATFELPDGDYELTASADGYEDVEHEVELDGDGEFVVLTLEASDEDDESDADEDDANTLTTVVVDDDGEPVENATVEVDEGGLFGDSDEADVNDDGEAVFELADGDYELTASADGYDDAEDDIELDGDDETVLLTLEGTAE